ncbi:MAG: translation factor Sua5, partial [FCB group bacterium]|nr:translation factor Sua5 [FCB group bacterium]
MKKQKINNDSIFLHHTGSMFGIGCSAFSKEAIAKINSLK